MNLEQKLEAGSIRVPETGCRLWEGGVTKNGYVLVGPKGAKKYGHRAAYEVSVGPIPPGMLVRHKCDARRCTEPTHLLLGTHLDNSSDARARGRTPAGAKNGRAALSLEEVAAIRADPRYQKDVAAAYGIDPSAVSLIKNGKRWGVQ